MRIGAAVLICFAFASCGGEAGENRDHTAELRAAFDEYNDALETRDWESACEHMAPESIAKLRDSVRALSDASPAKECSKLWDKLYTDAGEELADELIGEMVKTAKLDRVDVKGETATLNWHYTEEGERRSVSQRARTIDGKWKLIDALDKAG
jgi:hypothetical protein